jgi:hypothetical protein
VSQSKSVVDREVSLENNWSDNYRLLNGQPVPFDWPTLDDVVTEDETPVDSILCERQQRLLTEPLYSSWSAPGENRPFVALSNVGLFHARGENPLVPDMMLSLDVTSPQGKEIWLKHYRAYFIHVYGKAPEVVIEVVSNKVGQEADEKLKKYAAIDIKYYVLFDPDEHLSTEQLQIYALNDKGVYEKTNQPFFPEIGLGLTRWKGKYEETPQNWLRWTDLTGTLIATGAQQRKRADRQQERAEKAEQRAEKERQWAALTFQRVIEEHQRAVEADQRALEADQRALKERQRAFEADQLVEQERQRAEQERQRALEAEKRAEEERQRAEQAVLLAERLAAQLRALGIEQISE